MNEGPVIYVVGSDCGKPEKEKEFNDWYNNQHAPMMFRSPFVKRVKRFERMGEDKDYPKYIAIYEFENDKAMEAYFKSSYRNEVLEDSGAKIQSGDFVRRWRINYKQIASWKNSPCPSACKRLET